MRGSRSGRGDGGEVDSGEVSGPVVDTRPGSEEVPKGSHPGKESVVFVWTGTGLRHWKNCRLP